MIPIFDAKRLDKKIALLLGVFLVGTLIHIQGSVNNILGYQPDQTTLIKDRNNKIIYELFENENRILATSSEIPDSLKNATIAIEDQRFYKHNGIDPIAIIRAIKTYLKDKEVQGASTITQQYVKNAYLTHAPTFSRKAQEAIVSVILEKSLSKDKILENYLNEVSYGGIYSGVKTASRYYFDKDLKNLLLEESALLAALTKAPTRLSPKSNFAEIKKRQEIVLWKMYELGYISKEEFNKAKEAKLNLKFTPPVLKAPHFAMQIAKELKKNYPDINYKKQGWEVKTSLDISLQTKVEEIVKNEINSLKKHNVTNGATVVINPKNGEILAMVGSADFYDKNNGGEYNVLYSKRQPGSTFKPILYSLAFEEGYTPATVLMDEETTFVTPAGKYIPVNYDSKFRGAVTIRKALANSYNIPATRMHAVLGISSLISYAEKLGIEKIDEKNVGLSLALGGYEIRPIDLAQAYTVFASGGKLTKINPILKINDSQKKLIKNFEARSSEKVVNGDITYLISDILADDKTRQDAFGTNSLLNIPGKKVAVKTGTSNEYRDNWTVGYTPDFLVLSWVGNNDNSKMSQVASGITGATPIWHNTFEYLLKDKDYAWYKTPDSIVTEKINANLGGKFCNTGTETAEIFIKGTEPNECAESGFDKYVLVEKTSDGERNIELTNEDDFNKFSSDPMAYIHANKDMFLADDKPAEFTSIQKMAVIKDPLTKKTGEQNIILLTDSHQ